MWCGDDCCGGDGAAAAETQEMPTCQPSETIGDDQDPDEAEVDEVTD